MLYEMVGFLSMSNPIHCIYVYMWDCVFKGSSYSFPSELHASQVNKQTIVVENFILRIHEYSAM